jgi:DNA-binding transcriptional regulator PaaX
MAWADYAEILDLFCWTMDIITKPTFHNLVMGASDEPYERRRAERLMRRLREERLVASRGRRADAVTITASGRTRAALPDPRAAWRRPWDGAWRVVTFDLPETRRRDRMRLWSALRAHKLGLLQRSVWVWPHNVTPVLNEIVRAEGIPECFCGFEARRLFLCTDAEIVESAWNFDEIRLRQRGYLELPAATPRAIRRARSLPDLARIARVERRAYQTALELDPLLPSALWPAGYRGEPVEARHQQLRSQLRARFRELAADQLPVFANDR